MITGTCGRIDTITSVSHEISLHMVGFVLQLPPYTADIPIKNFKNDDRRPMVCLQPNLT
jgi:hypothetical protein